MTVGERERERERGKERERGGGRSTALGQVSLSIPSSQGSEHSIEDEAVGGL